MYSAARSAIAVSNLPHERSMRLVIYNSISAKIITIILRTAPISGKHCENDAVRHLPEDCESFHQFYSLNIKPSFSKAFLVEVAVIIIPLYIVDSWESKGRYLPYLLNDERVWDWEARLYCRYYRTAQRAPGVLNLKLHHKQMNYRQGSFFKDLKGKSTIKIILKHAPV